MVVVTSRARALMVVTSTVAATVLLALAVALTVHDAATHRRVVLEEDDEGYHHQVASGLPAAYDGRWGAQYRRNAGGHEKAFHDAHLNYDDYPADIYKGVPWFSFDPSATKQREINQKVFPPRKLARSHIQQSGANKGGETWPVGWGTWNEGGPSQDHLRSHGIKVDHWPIDVYHGFPNPAWDRSEQHTERNVFRMPPADAKETAQRQHDSEHSLKKAGVHVSGLPWDESEGAHAYNNVDGFLDALVPNQPTPQFRKGGLAAQERPQHFLLEDTPPKHSQAAEIEGVFESGELDHRGQRVENAEEGYEEDREGETLPELYREREEEEEEQEEEDQEAAEQEQALAQRRAEEEERASPTDDVYEVVPRNAW